MTLNFNKNTSLHFMFLVFLLFLGVSCMHVKNLDNLPGTTSKEISLNLNRLSNPGEAGSEYFYSVIESDEYYIAVGYSTSDLSSLTGGSTNQGFDDFVIAKFNKSDLSLVHINNLGGTANDYFSSIIESDVYYIVVGYSQSNLSGLNGGNANQGGWDFVISKFNKSDLSLVSINNLGGTGWDYLKAVIESDGYYIATGNSYSNLSGLTGGSASQGDSDFVISKFNKSDLSLVSINNLGGTDTDYFLSLAESNGYYITSGSSKSDLSGLTGGSTNQGNTDFVISKFNKSDLSLVSINNLGGTAEDWFYSIIESDNYYVAVGNSDSDLSGLIGGANTQGFADFVIAKFNKLDLSLVNINNFGGTSTDYLKSVIKSGNYYIAAGYSMSDLSGLTGGSTNQGLSDFTISKFNKADLSLAAINNLGGTSSESLSSLIESDNHYVAVGYSNSDLSGLTGGAANQGPDFAILKFGD